MFVVHPRAAPLESAISRSNVRLIQAIDGEKALFDCCEIRERCVIFSDNPPARATSGVCSIHAIMLEAACLLVCSCRRVDLVFDGDHHRARIGLDFASYFRSRHETLGFSREDF
jgi:hypothetical protein